MSHLNVEDMVQHHYHDAGGKAFRVAQRHLNSCAACAAESAKLADDMKSMDGLDYEQLSGEYGERVWNRIAAKLPALGVEEAPRRSVRWQLALGYAAACAVLVTAAFEVGRVWESRKHVPHVAVKPAAPAERQVVVVVLGDHLDRTERLLVELKHADGEDAEMVKPLREEAQSLLVANRVFLEDADKSGDTALTQALDHLDHLLGDVANAPGGLNTVSIARLQREMKAGGLLFKVRVLRSRPAHQEMTARITAKGGAA